MCFSKIDSQEELLRDRFAKVESLEQDKQVLNAKELKVSYMLQEAHDRTAKANTRQEALEKKAMELSEEWKKLEVDKCKFESLSRQLDELKQKEAQLTATVRWRILVSVNSTVLLLKCVSLVAITLLRNLVETTCLFSGSSVGDEEE